MLRAVEVKPRGISQEFVAVAHQHVVLVRVECQLQGGAGCLPLGERDKSAAGAGAQAVESSGAGLRFGFDDGHKLEVAADNHAEIVVAKIALGVVRILVVEREGVAAAAEHGLLERVAQEGETAPREASAQHEVAVHAVGHAAEIRQVAFGVFQDYISAGVR